MKERTKVAFRTPLWRVTCARIRDHFIASGKSMKEFAQDLGMDRTTLWKWLAGLAAPRPDNIDNVAAVLDVPRKCLLCDDDDTVCPDCTPKRRPPRS